ncbi:hypothetical protein KR009_003666 [Drosophila setifemur]|nr:hypothetical protein KR009_003666 [Drosophila setifemur]
MPVVELRVDRSLLCPSFDGYKLSFDPVPVLRQDCDPLGDPLKLEPHHSQYSLLHVELFARHNLLCADPWMRHTSYYMNRRHELVQCVYDAQVGRPRGQQRVVLSLDMRDHGDGYEHWPGDYNYSLCFLSERFLLICDGMTTLHLVDTGDRSRSSTDLWQRVTRTPVDQASGNRGFVLYDARLDIVQERKQISILAGHVARRETGPEGNRTHVYYMDLTWSRWTQASAGGEWSYSICQKLETTGSMLYCAFEPRAESLIIASNRDVQTPEERVAAETAAAANPPPPSAAAQLQNGGSPANFSWTQTDEEVVVRFPLPQNFNRQEFHIRCSSETVQVKHLERELLTGTLFGRVDNDLTTWNFEGETELQLTLIKQEALRWPRLMREENPSMPDENEEWEGDRQPPADPALPIPNLEDPIEECDLGLADEDIKMVRFNLSAGEITHTIFLGPTPPLFAATLRPGYPAAFATRHGVDAAVWLQMYQPSRPDEWTVRHEGQLHAFGYVQASKEQRKFTACCPDLEFVTICESHRHVLIYRPRHDTAGGLRKRNGPPVLVGKQSLVTLDEDVGEILGLTTASNLITILTEHALLHLQV